MTPDIGYYIGRFDLANFAHTLPGSFDACLPTGVIMLCVFYLFSRPVCYALPSPHRQSLLPLCSDFPLDVKRWGILLVSLLLGAWTHNFWDAFTHEHGWFVDRIFWLQQPLVRLRYTTVHVYLALQEGSTIVGFVIVAVAYWLWLRRQPVNPTLDSESDRWRYLFWFGIGALALVIAVPAAAQYATSTSLRGFLFGRSVLFRVAIYGSAVAVPLVLLGTGVIYARRPR